MSNKKTLRQPTLWNQKPAEVVPKVVMPTFLPLDSKYTKLWRLYSALHNRENQQTLQQEFNKIWKSLDIEYYMQMVTDAVAKYEGSLRKPIKDRVIVFCPLPLPVCPTPGYEAWVPPSPIDPTLAPCWLAQVPINRTFCHKAVTLRAKCVPLAHSLQTMIEQYHMFTKDSKKKSVYRTKLVALEEQQECVLEAMHALNEAPLRDIGKAEEHVLGSLLAWETLAKNIRPEVARQCSQQMANMNRQEDPELYCLPEGLAVTDIDVAQLTLGPLTPTAVCSLVEQLFAVGHVQLAPFATTVVGQTSLGKICCACLPCVMIHYPRKRAVLIALDRLRFLADDVDDMDEVQIDVPEVDPKPRGRPLRIEDKFPQILDTLAEVLKDLVTPRADKRRRDDVCHVGIGAGALQTALSKRGIDVSVQSVRALFLPPACNLNSAKLYKGLLHYRMYSPKQDKHADNIDAHYTSAQVRIVVEMAADSQEAAIFSVDAKALVRCGADVPAVSEGNKVPSYGACNRRAKPKRNEGQWEGGVSLMDHVWAPELTIHPFGVMRVAIPSTPLLEYDDKNRSHTGVPRTGSLTFYLRHTSNSLTDASDLCKEVTAAGKPVAIVMVDNCKQDLGPGGYVTFFAWGRVWHQSKVDVLVAVSYAPGQSYNNWIELLFGWVSQRLTGHCISDDPSLSRQQLKDLVDGMRDGHPVNCHIPADDDLLWSDYDNLVRFTKASSSLIRRDQTMRDLYAQFCFLLRHCDRRTNMLVFRRCRQSSCDCMKVTPILSTNFVGSMQLMSNRMPTPVPNPSYASPALHYFTWHQLKERGAELVALPDEHQPSARIANVGRCQWCNWVFTSKGERQHHNRLRHPANGVLLDE